MDENRKGEFEINFEEQPQTYYESQISENETVIASPTAKKKNVFLIVWKIVVALIYVLVTAFIAYLLIDALNTPPPQQGQIDGRGFALAAFIILAIIFGLIGYLANVITSIIGIIVSSSHKKQQKCGNGSIVYFVIFTFLPIISFFVWIILPGLIK